MAFENIDVATFAQKIKELDNAVILDVRTPAEIAEAAIDGHVAINIMHPEFTQRIAELDKEKTYLVYCRSGNRSGKACAYMSNLGFKTLYNLDGGIMAWQAQMG